MSEPITKTIQLTHVFTDTEKLEMGDRLAEIPIEIEAQNRVLESLKEKTKTAKTKVESLEDEQLTLARKYESGEEVRGVECLVMMNFPEDGKKTITRQDTAEVWEEVMVEADFDLFGGVPAAPTGDMTVSEELVEKFNGVEEAEIKGANIIEDEEPQPEFTSEIKDKFGIDPEEVIHEESFTVNGANVLVENGIPSELLPDIAGCLMIKSKPDNLADLISSRKLQLKGTLPAEEGIYWFAFGEIANG